MQPACGRDPEVPYSGSGLTYPEHHQLFSGIGFHQYTLNRDPRPFVNKSLSSFTFHSKTDGRNDLSSRRSYRHVEQIRYRSPEFHDKSSHTLAHTYLHIPIPIGPPRFHRNLPEKMMRSISLIAAAYHHSAASPASYPV